MFKKLLSVSILLFLAAWAPAQGLLESVLFAGFGSWINRQLSHTSEKVVSPCKLMFDIMLPDGKVERIPQDDGSILERRSSGYRFTNFIWDPTTQTSVFIQDGTALRVKPFKNGPPPGDLQVFINDRAYTKRNVKPGSFDGKNQPKDNLGVVGGYPIIDACDLPEGACQIKVRFSRTEWATAEFTRVHSVADVLNEIANEDTRTKLYGFEGASFPSVPTFVAQMPDGNVRSFLSVDEMNRTIASFNPGKTGEIKKNPLPHKSTNCWSGEVRVVEYDLAAARGADRNELRDELLKGLAQVDPLKSVDDALVIADGHALAVQLASDQPFTATQAGKRFTAIQDGDRYLLLLGVSFSDSQANNPITVSGAGGDTTLRFDRKRGI